MARQVILYADTRDMSRAQFNAALKRHGFTQNLFWFTHKDCRNVSHGGLIHPKSKKLWRRGTLAKIIEMHAREMAKQTGDPD